MKDDQIKRRRINYLSDYQITQSGDHDVNKGWLFSGMGRDRMTLDEAWFYLMRYLEKPIEFIPPRYFDNFECPCEQIENLKEKCLKSRKKEFDDEDSFVRLEMTIDEARDLIELLSAQIIMFEDGLL